jgi:hypothetical protein
MKLELTDTLQYDGETLEYDSQYFTRGLMNQAVRVYTSEEGSELHYDPQTGLKKLVGPEGDSKRVEVADDVRGSGVVELRDSGHRSY